MKFEEIQQPCEANNYVYSRKEYVVDFAWKEVENTEIGDLPADVFIYDLSDKDLAVYQEKVITIVEEECKSLNYNEINTLKESLRDKVKEKAIALVAVASALTLGVLSWGACHPEKTVEDLVYPATGAHQLHRENYFKMYCSSAKECALSDAQAFNDILNAQEKALKGDTYPASQLEEKICSQISWYSKNINQDCKAMVDPIVERLEDGYFNKLPKEVYEESQLYDR